MTILVKLVASNIGIGGYITYVFENLEDSSLYSKYHMVTRFPNWNCPLIEVGDIGYLKYEDVVAGIDKWYDGKSFVPYNYNMSIFINFVNKVVEEKSEFIM